MTEPVHEPAATPLPPKVPGSPHRKLWLRAVLPHVLTVVVAVALSITAQLLLQQPTASVLSPTSSPLPSPVPQPTFAPTNTPALTPLPSGGIVQQELIDLQIEDDRIWMAIYLVRTISQVADAEAALRVNDLSLVEQSLVAMDDSLALAYERASDPARNPIDELRRQVGTLREDLYLHPEGMDADLLQLRQTIRALIEERGSE